MAHTHDHGQTASRKVLLFSFLITTVYMIIEAAGGFLTNSLALLSDAGHMLSDSISLGVGVLAFTLGAKSADPQKTFGYRRFEILAAVFNGTALLAVSIVILVEAFRRFAEPPDVSSIGMLWIAIAGLVVNLLVAYIMRKGDTHGNLNVRAAFLHVLGDLLGSVGAILAAFLIMFFDWSWADPLASIVVAILVLISGWRVTRDAVHVLMEGTPSEVDIQAVEKQLRSFEEVTDVHDLHIWSISSGFNAIACHIEVRSDFTMRKAKPLLTEIERRLAEENIHHSTIQFEPPAYQHVLDEEGPRH
ncbi:MULTISPECIES: cation diffusion facilitator family transporter [Sporosarcina]|uniref:cation diffusion facilitator family transporter n=1 Tax=Sporosarcina TaxID=1569 RepID=UPI00058CFA1A|nr:MULTISPECIES: cation diffusion facilitator family transporter [Sporosarcina]WJY26657.1 cation diffusion facilitator family transporter [Sporosarcina sp. 0.2-SM1T-5]